ncbi:MAG: HEAT repeat domain-containing protein [Planctomycetota bacterium]
MKSGPASQSVFASGVCFVAVLSLAVGCGGGESSRYDDPSRANAAARASVAEARLDRERGDLRNAALIALQDLVRSPDALTRANAAEALELVPSALDEIAPAVLLDDNIGVRSIAAVAVGRSGLRRHEPLLRGMLSDESDYARASAIYALTVMGFEVDRSPMAGFLLSGEPFGLRGHTAYLLGELGDPSAIDLLRDAAKAPMERASVSQRRVVELQISEAMIKLGDQQQLGAVRAALFPSQTSDLEAMALAIQIVGEVGDSASRGRLVQIAETQDSAGQRMPPEVQLAIAISMAKLGDRNGWFVADEFWDASRDVLRADAAAVFGWTGRENDLRRLRTMLDDRSGRVRASAAAGILRAVTTSDASLAEARS